MVEGGVDLIYLLRDGRALRITPKTIEVEIYLPFLQLAAVIGIRLVIIIRCAEVEIRHRVL